MVALQFAYEHSCWLLLGIFCLIAARAKLPYDTELRGIKLCLAGSFILILACEALLPAWIGIVAACGIGLCTTRYWLVAGAYWKEYCAVAVGALTAAETARLCLVMWTAAQWLTEVAAMGYSIAVAMLLLTILLDARQLINWLTYR